MYSCFTISMIKKPVVRRFVQFKTLLKYLPNARLRARINPTWHKIFFGGLDMGGGWYSPPPGKHPSGTFMSSNDLVIHQAHKNGQF